MSDIKVTWRLLPDGSLALGVGGIGWGWARAGEPRGLENGVERKARGANAIWSI